MKNMKRWASVLLAICMLLAATPVPAESDGTLTATATPAVEQSAEPTGTVTAEPTNTATTEPENTATAEPTNTATAESTDEAAGTPTPIPTDEATGTPTPVPTDEATGTPTPHPAGESTHEPAASASAEPTATASFIPEIAPALAANVALTASNAMVNNGTMAGTGTWEIDIENNGLISAGNYTRKVYNSTTGRITGGNFTGSLENYNSVTGAYLDCEITNFGTIEGCTFGPNAKVSSNSGTIELTVNVDGQGRKVNFGDNILAKLGGETWYYVSGDTYTKVEAGDSFDLSTLTFSSTAPVVLPAPSADINYFDETVTITLPNALDSSVDKAELILAFTLNGVKYTKEGAFASGDSYTIDLSNLGTGLGATLPYDKNYSHVDEIGVFLAVDKVEGEVFTFKVAARPAVDRPSGAGCSQGYDSIQLLDGLTDTFDFGLAKKESSTASAPSEPEYIDEDGDGLITGLEEGTTYWVYLRRKATSTSFRSEWGYNYWNTTSTTKATHLTVSTKTPTYTWRPSFNLPSFNITNSILFNKADGGTLAINKKYYSLAITDANDNAISYISDAGVYTVKVTLEDYNNCVLDDDTFTITVKPLDLSAENVILELDLWEEQKAVYTGAPTYPQLGDAEIKIKIDGNSSGYLGTDYYTVGAAEGKNNVNAGEAWLTISAKDGQSNVIGSQEVAYQILTQQATLAVDEEHCEAVWSKDFTLTEEALRALFTVNDASGKALDGGLYTITVTKDGTAASLPIEDAGAYTIKVTLTTANYTLAEDSFTYTIAKLPFTGTVSMAGYVYEGTASQPVLNGYDGNGEVTFLYRTEGGETWQEWPEDITGISLVPGNYEIKASVAATQNYAGGETAAASFTISPAKLGVSIEMPDYTYGGTVPTPALTPETFGLTVAWFFKGADDVEHPWENITGTTLTAGGYTIIARVEASALYEAAELTSTFTVNKAAAPEIDWPEVTQGITYGQALSEATLSATADAYGTFTWQNPDAILSAGEQTAALVYTPRDTANYDYTGVPTICEMRVEVVPKDISGMTVDAIPAQTATGSALTPTVTVRDGDAILTAGADYTVAYANNIKPGTATATITGVGNYAGTLTATFTIREAEKNGEDENDESTTETLTPEQQVENLAAGEAVDGTVTDRHGEAMPYVPSTEEVTDEETQEVLQRTLVIAAEPLLDEDGQPILRDGQPVYEQRNLHLTRGLLDALTECGYTHIRFALGDAALEWQIAEMIEDGYVVRLAPMEANELSQAEKDAIGDAEALTGSYRARITAMIEGEETDVTNAIPSLTVIFDAASVRALADGETPQLLLVPNDGEPEMQVSTVQYIEETDSEPTRYEALLTESGLFVLTLQ